MDIFRKYQKNKQEYYKKIQTEAPIFAAIVVIAIVAEIILLVTFGGWWIFLFGIVTIQQALFMQSSFYTIVSNTPGWIKTTAKVVALYGVLFPLVYVPPILDGTEYSYILFGLRPEPGSFISNIISVTSPYAWNLLGIAAGISVAGVIYTFTKKRRLLSKTK